jgi:hypothetical protein
MRPVDGAEAPATGGAVLGQEYGDLRVVGEVDGGTDPRECPMDIDQESCHVAGSAVLEGARRVWSAGHDSDPALDRQNVVPVLGVLPRVDEIRAHLRDQGRESLTSLNGFERDCHPAVHVDTLLIGHLLTFH